jgi:hypothetical protein
MDIYERARYETKTLRLWVESQKDKIESFIPENPSDHPAISLGEIIDRIADVIKTGDDTAIELGCDLLLENKKICFGVSLKTRILSSLKTQKNALSGSQKWKLTKLTILLLSLDFPPREIKWYCRLIRSFEPQYKEKVMEVVTPRTQEAQRWLDFFSRKKI